MAHHGDDNGLILPPWVAPKQVVIVPILFRKREQDVLNYTKKLMEKLEDGGFRVVLDDDDRVRPGEKYYKWEQFGVPLRIEVGPREVDNLQVTMVRRDTGEKVKGSFDSLNGMVGVLLDGIMENITRRSREYLERNIADAHSLEELKANMEAKKIVRVNWCGDPACAFEIKDQISGEIRGTRWDIKETPEEGCIYCSEEAKYVAYVSRTY
jgi:prolyl-tRNA synthetase